MMLSLVRLSRRTVGVVGVALLVVLVVLAIFTRLAPLLGRDLYIVGGGSMEPSLPLGSLAIAARVDPMTIASGDVVTFRAPGGTVITHRVTRVVDGPDGRAFETKGDANDSADGTPVPATAILGVADRYVPYAGYLQSFLSQTSGVVAAVMAIGALLLAYVFLEMVERSVVAPAQARESAAR
jgi:signal peptidase I